MQEFNKKEIPFVLEFVSFPWVTFRLSCIFSITSMPSTPNKLNLSFTRNAYSVFGSRNAATANEHQREQKTELLEGKSKAGISIVYHILNIYHIFVVKPTNSSRGHWYRSALNKRVVPLYFATLPRLSSTMIAQFPFSLIPLVIWRDRSYKGQQRHRCRQKRAAFCTRLPPSLITNRILRNVAEKASNKVRDWWTNVQDGWHRDDISL